MYGAEAGGTVKRSNGNGEGKVRAGKGR